MGDPFTRLELSRYINGHEHKDQLALGFALSQFSELAKYPNSYLADVRGCDLYIIQLGEERKAVLI